MNAIWSINASHEGFTRCVLSLDRLADAGRLFYADSALSMKKDPALPVLKTFTQVPKADTANAVSTVICA